VTTCSPLRRQVQTTPPSVNQRPSASSLTLYQWLCCATPQRTTRSTLQRTGLLCEQADHAKTALTFTAVTTSAALTLDRPITSARPAFAPTTTQDHYKHPTIALHPTNRQHALPPRHCRPFLELREPAQDNTTARQGFQSPRTSTSAHCTQEARCDPRITRDEPRIARQVLEPANTKPAARR
jgi:hypothetical protein